MERMIESYAALGEGGDVSRLIKNGKGSWLAMYGTKNNEWEEMEEDPKKSKYWMLKKTSCLFQEGGECRDPWLISDQWFAVAMVVGLAKIEIEKEEKQAKKTHDAAMGRL